jgi:hypothetical protein
MLAGMAMLMEGKCVGGGAASGTNPPESKIPVAGSSMYLRYEKMLSQVDPYELRKARMIVLKGEEELFQAQRGAIRVKKFETREARSARIVAMYCGWSPAEVSIAEQCSEGFVRKVRAELGVNQIDGEKE